MQNTTDPQWPVASPLPQGCWHPKCGLQCWHQQPGSPLTCSTRSTPRNLTFTHRGLAQGLLSPTCLLPTYIIMCLQVTFQNKLPSYFNCNVSTCTENAKVSVTGELLIYKWRAALGWLHLKPLRKASHPYLVSLATETQLRETPSLKLGERPAEKNCTPVGESLFFRDFMRHCFNLGQINFLTPFLLQYTEISCLGGYGSMSYLASSQILQLSAKGWIFPKTKY